VSAAAATNAWRWGQQQGRLLLLLLLLFAAQQCILQTVLFVGFFYRPLAGSMPVSADPADIHAARG
jgi:hypothetical protein